MASKIRFAPIAAPTIELRMTKKPLVVLNPSHAPMRAPLIAAAKPVVLVLGDQSRSIQAKWPAGGCFDPRARTR
jgi:hypothetical protein